MVTEAIAGWLAVDLASCAERTETRATAGFVQNGVSPVLPAILLQADEHSVLRREPWLWIERQPTVAIKRLKVVELRDPDGFRDSARERITCVMGQFIRVESRTNRLVPFSTSFFACDVPNHRRQPGSV